MVKGLQDELIGIQDKHAFERRDVVVQTKCHQFQKHIVVVLGFVVRQTGRIIGDHGGV